MSLNRAESSGVMSYPLRLRNSSAKSSDQSRPLTPKVNSSEKKKFSRLLSYAYGYIGQLYEDEKLLIEALLFTRKATFIAQEIKSKGREVVVAERGVGRQQ